MMKLALLCAMIALAAVGVSACRRVGVSAGRGEPLVPQTAQPYRADLLSAVRRAAAMVPGSLPARINYIKFAESHRPLADIIDGGSQEDYVSSDL
jgi:hypothetical protein